MPPVSFDRAAEYYDGTRGYADGSAERIRDAIVAYASAGRDTRFLELGIGTGRIALPFIRAGYDYTGVDISPAMMARLADKLAGDSVAAAYRYRLHAADITALPFEAQRFDVIIAVHVLHLVADWQRAIQEARRVLRPSEGGADVVIVEPVWCDGSFSCTDALPMARQLLILDTTLVGPGADLRPYLQAARCPLVIAYSSGLKLDQAGMELANVGIVRIYARDDARHTGAALRRIRSLVGAGLTLDEMSALSASWFMDRAYADRYVGAIFANNRRLAAAIGPRSAIFAPHCHPSLHRQGADAPFCALQLNEPSLQAYRALERLVALECERRDIVVTKGGSFGFRGHRFELIEPEPGQGEPFLRVAMGWRDGWSCRRLCALFEELAQGR